MTQSGGLYLGSQRMPGEGQLYSEPGYSGIGCQARAESEMGLDPPIPVERKYAGAAGRRHGRATSRPCQSR